ncbi:surfeit locus protein 6 homolog [Planococcus citri]|uniref:surfeit locus protein 6 homolog n=1 Tax=Planococcus citri TaxID=170843 RepID=UPI0031F8111B
MTVKILSKNNRSHVVKQQYLKEFRFISDLLTNVDLPCQEAESSDSENENNSKRVKLVGTAKDIDRAKTLVELNERLSALKEQKYTYKGKKLKNRLQSKLKKKKKVYENKVKRNPVSCEQKDIKSETVDRKNDLKPPKPVFNSEGNVVFSKFDFLGATSNANESEALSKQSSNKKLILEKLEKEQGYIKKLEEMGETEKAAEIKEERVWKNVFNKAEGIKVKDDPLLLKKSLAKKKAQKKASEKKWKERISNVEKQKEERQKKRSDNLTKRRQEMKKKKVKKAMKKGRFISNS